MSDHIPDDVWPQIFEKSIPETLIRCRCVCKAWKSLISSQRFMAAHLAAQKPHLIIKVPANNLQQTPVQPEYCVVFRPETLPRRLDLPFLADTPGFCIVGTVSGVVCLAYESTFEGTNHIVLWNPSIRKSVYPPLLAPGYTSTVGFGFDASRNELRVVRIARVIKCGLFGFGGCRRIPPKAEVYSVREGRWRTIGYGFFDCHKIHNRWSQCLLNGAAHWPAYSRARKDVLLSFHFETEEFAIIQLPPEVEVVEASVSKLGGLLSVVHYKSAPGEAWARGCDVWAMHKYGEASSWCKMASVRWESWDWGGMRTVVWVGEDAGEMIVSTENGELLRCNTRDWEAKPIGIQCEDDGSFADGFVRSLVLLDV